MQKLSSRNDYHQSKEGHFPPIKVQKLTGVQEDEEVREVDTREDHQIKLNRYGKTQLTPTMSLYYSIKTNSPKSVLTKIKLIFKIQQKTIRQLLVRTWSAKYDESFYSDFEDF